MYEKLDDSHGYLIDEVNEAWLVLQSKHSFLLQYANCDDLLKDARIRGSLWRSMIFSIIRDGCNYVISDAENALLIILAFPELEIIFKYKAAKDRENSWSLILTEFLDQVRNNDSRDLTAVVKEVSNSIKRWNDKEMLNRRKMMVVDSMTFYERGYQPDDGLEFEDFVKVLKQSGTNRDWLDKIMANLGMDNISASGEYAAISDYQKKKTRDIIAQKIRKDVPELIPYIKERQLNKKRRSCEI
ncbi:MAG: hypothetical protein LUH04_05315 [Clostridium sp.]|nr:hypothetical protein [Clostridium sp.]